LHHENLVSIYDIDVTADRRLFIIMEPVEGMTLRQLRPRYGDLHWALPILQQIATGLATIPGRGILHRDLKPANILIASSAATAPPRVKLVDFGISILARDTDLSDPTPTPSDRNAIPDATSTGVLVGTVRDALPLFVDVLRGGLSPQEAILRAR
jgi:serine/threonine protein kinase